MKELLAESTTFYWSTPTLHPAGERWETLDHYRESSHFLKFKELFDALAVHDPGAARKEVASWDSVDPVFFAKLFLYAASLPDLVAREVFAKKLLAMPDAPFWDSGLSRELLWALRARWASLRVRDRTRIEGRIVRGRPRREGETRADHRASRNAWSASWLRWLELNGCTLSPSTAAKLPRLVAAEPRWSEDWARNADDSLGSRSGFVERVTESRGLEAAPIAQIVSLASVLSTDDRRELRDYRPFDGLVKLAAFKALAALRIVARRGSILPPSGTVSSITGRTMRATG
ncbi:MAG: hypothetical protein H0W74_13905 [Sphingosinicella sp.]|nr:hypothetical protein [Sphingosinicella sp.]